MYERFTDRARQVIQIAKKEAHKLNHNYVGTEHLLLGLLGETGGISTRIFRSYGFDPHAMLARFRETLVQGPDATAIENPPFTPRTQRVLAVAVAASSELRCGYVGTEHLLFAMLKEMEGPGIDTLLHSGMTWAGVLERLTLYPSTRPPINPNLGFFTLEVGLQ